MRIFELRPTNLKRKLVKETLADRRDEERMLPRRLFVLPQQSIPASDPCSPEEHVGSNLELGKAARKAVP